MKKLLMRAWRWRVRTPRDRITVILVSGVASLTFIAVGMLLDAGELLDLFELTLWEFVILHASIGFPLSLTAWLIVFKLRVREDSP